MIEEQGYLFADCSHLNTTVVPAEKSSPHYAKRVCNDCKKFLGWIPKPETEQRRLENFQILSGLTKVQLTEWERQFVRDLASHKNISPKQQALLLQLRDRYLK